MKYEQPRWSYRISNTKQTMAILRYFVPFLTFIAANSFFRFLGSEGTAIMTAGGNIVLFGILLLILTFFFRKNRFRLSFPLVFLLYISIIFSISLFGCCLRAHFLSNFGLYFQDVFSFVVALSVGSGGGQPLPLPAPSSPSNSSSEDSFGLQVLSEPWPVTHNIAYESSLRSRAGK